MAALLCRQKRGPPRALPSRRGLEVKGCVHRVPRRCSEAAGRWSLRQFGVKVAGKRSLAPALQACCAALSRGSLRVKCSPRQAPTPLRPGPRLPPAPPLRSHYQHSRAGLPCVSQTSHRRLTSARARPLILDPLTARQRTPGKRRGGAASLHARGVGKLVWAQRGAAPPSAARYQLSHARELLVCAWRAAASPPVI